MIRFAFAALAVLVSVPLGASPAEAAEFKIGYVDMARAFRELDDSKAAQNKLKSDFADKQKRLDAMQSKLKAKKEDFEKQAGMMKSEIKMQRQEELQREFMQLQQTYMQLQQELASQEGELIKTISDKMKRIVEKVGDREGYDMILDASEGEAVLYYKKHLDVTDQVIREYNRAYAKK